ncbi:CHAP domain-containing protein [Nocardia cyriacigeorgica]|uniref:CHAP domain-containing protein n=2 Tax=Nocardia cyriacigeorgica TaxID=135487 RepID=A0ABX0CFD6_9NOCA|nr:CHAP domain-containing protein [Nocardia cyriacigeorgica]NEW40998.1 CHAP domain-containing protein [Nocardia cyriacigeorgica]NEW55268.1 CHAP domain-containing protein [Nocardia cyriacigeorgica]
MSLATDLEQIDNLQAPGNSPPGLVSTVNMAKLAIRVQVLQFASGEPSGQPDLLERLRKAKLLRNSDIDGTDAKSVMVEKYGERKSDFQDIENDLRAKSKSVDGSVTGTYDTANGTHKKVMEQVGIFREALADAANLSKGKEEMPPHIANRTSAIALRVADQVYDLVDGAYTKIKNDAAAIKAAMPDVKQTLGNSPSAMGGRSPISMPSGGSYSQASGGEPYRTASSGRTPWTGNKQSVIPNTGQGPIADAITLAISEVGTREDGSSNYVPGKEYDIYDIYGRDGAWCSSFATWLWEKAGITPSAKSFWRGNQKNSVSSVWAQAGQKGLHGKISTAQPGDLIVWGHQNHIGMVVARNGNSVTVVEGNAGNAVQKNTYDLSRGGFAGVIHPPASSGQGQQQVASVGN